MEFLSVPNLKLDDNFFEYQERKYRYDKVVSIEFAAAVTKHSVNFVPAGTSYDAKLTIYMDMGDPFEIMPAKSWFGKLKESGFDELQRVNAALKFMTFNYRVSHYEAQVQQNGMFRMGGYEFHKNGDLSKGGKFITNLRDGSHNFLLGAFSVVISKKKKSFTEKLKSSWSGESEIYIGKDRDCFIYLLKEFYGLSWSSEQVPEKRVDNKRLYYETVVRLGAWLSAVDGDANPSELTQLKKFFQIDYDSFPEAAKVFNEQLSSPKSPQSILGKFNSAFKEASELRESLYVGLLSVALADQVFHPAEMQAIDLLGRLLGFSKSQLIRLYASMGLDYMGMFDPEESGTEAGGGARQKSSGDTQREQHLRVLGLEAGCSEVDIRVSYRKLVKRYHPDILRSQGLPENEMKHSQYILGQVIDSYKWLMQAA